MSEFLLSSFAFVFDFFVFVLEEFSEFEFVNVVSAIIVIKKEIDV